MLLKVMQIIIMLLFWILLMPSYNLKHTESAVRNRLINSLSELRGFKSVMTLVVELKKKIDDTKK